MTTKVNPKITDLVGHDSIRKTILETVIVCKSDQRPVPNMLFIGNSGCGKTTLAQAIADLMQVEFYSFLARVIDEDISEFIREISQRKGKILLFVDEVHQLAPLSQESFYPILDASGITVICATTDTGKLIRPFQNRFKLVFNISSYSHEEAIQIIERYAERNGILLTTKAKLTIAIRSRGVPRTMERHVDGAWQKAKFNFLTHKQEKALITEAIALEYFVDQGIDNKGLTPQEQNILMTLIRNGGTVSLTTLCSICQIDINQFVEFYEPWLSECQFINKSPRGRSITGKGIQHIMSNGISRRR